MDTPDPYRRRNLIVAYRKRFDERYIDRGPRINYASNLTQSVLTSTPAKMSRLTVVCVAVVLLAVATTQTDASRLGCRSPCQMRQLPFPALNDRSALGAHRCACEQPDDANCAANHAWCWRDDGKCWCMDLRRGK